MEELKDLHDIRGLAKVTSWPLAWGWWLLIGLICIVAILLGYKLYKLYLYRSSWQFKAYQRLEKLNDILLSTRATKEVLQCLTIELRKIGMASATRESCAALAGKSWLLWLKQHDPNKFAWDQDGEVLINARYGAVVPEKVNSDVERLILAAQQWVKKC